jgi:putative SOS response-associated peptidase YedK
MRPIHDRMPVVLPPTTWDRWPDRSETSTADLVELLVPAPEDLLVRRPVSQRVNNVKNEGSELLNSA